jgi:hypothetical protein
MQELKMLTGQTIDEGQYMEVCETEKKMSKLFRAVADGNSNELIVNTKSVKAIMP